MTIMPFPQIKKKDPCGRGRNGRRGSLVDIEGVEPEKRIGPERKGGSGEERELESAWDVLCGSLKTRESGAATIWCEILREEGGKKILRSFAMYYEWNPPLMFS